MQIRCVAIDDEPLALEVLMQYISRIPVLRLLQTFTDPVAGSEFLRHTPADLLFLDINMPDISGLDLVRLLPARLMVIFTTAHKEFALEGFELDALDFLLKPFAFERFAKAVNKAVEFNQYRNMEKPEGAGHLFVRSEYQLVKIELDDIEYIESVEDYLKIHRAGQKPIMTLMTLKALLHKLPQNRFVRIHRSYVVPLAKIRSIVNRKVRLSSIELPLGDSYAGMIKNWKGK